MLGSTKAEDQRDEVPSTDRDGNHRRPSSHSDTVGLSSFG